MKRRLRALGVSLIVLGGCAQPMYDQRAVALSSSPSMPIEQAMAICEPQAQLTGYQARNQTIARQIAEHNAGAPTGFAQGFTEANEQYSIQRETAAAVLRMCLGRLGWGVQSVCVRNCR